MGVVITQPISLHFDKKSGIVIAKNYAFHERAKNIDIECHFTHHYLQCIAISPLSVPSAL